MNNLTTLKYLCFFLALLGMAASLTNFGLGRLTDAGMDLLGGALWFGFGAITSFIQGRVEERILGGYP